MLGINYAIITDNCKGEKGDSKGDPGPRTFNESYEYGFGFVLENIRSGLKFTRTGWNAKNQYIFINPTEDRLYNDMKVNKSFSLKNAQGEIQEGWIPSMGDLFATDWHVVDLNITRTFNVLWLENSTLEVSHKEMMELGMLFGEYWENVVNDRDWNRMSGIDLDNKAFLINDINIETGEVTVSSFDEASFYLINSMTGNNLLPRIMYIHGKPILYNIDYININDRPSLNEFKKESYEFSQSIPKVMADRFYEKHFED